MVVTQQFDPPNTDVWLRPRPSVFIWLSNKTQRNGTEPSKRTSKRKHEIYTGYGKHLQHSVTGDFKNTIFLWTISMKIKHFKVIGGLLLLSGTVCQALYRNYLNIFNDNLLNLPILVFLIGMMTCCVSLLGLLGSSQRQRWKGS